MHKWTDENSELMCIKLVCNEKYSVNVIGAYRSPSCNPIEFLESLKTHLCHLTQEGTKNHPIILGGDLNLPQVSWKTEPDATRCKIQKVINTIMEDNDMIQVIKKATHAGDNILDVFLVTPPSTWLKSSVEPGISDHKLITLTVDINVERHSKQPKRIIWAYQKADVIGINTFMSEAFQEWKLAPGNIETFWSNFKSLLEEARGKYVPQRVLKNNHDPLYYNAEIRRLKKKCRVAYKTRKTNEVKFKEAIKALNIEKKKALHDHMASLVDKDRKDNWKNFYSHIKHVKGSNNIIPALQTAGTLALTDLEKAQVLNTTYEKVFNSEPRWNIKNKILALPSISPKTTLPKSSFKITANCITKAVRRIRFKTGSGPDGVTSQMLKISQPATTPYLETLFNISVNNSQIPAEWSTATVHPIYKSGSRSDPSNYRPISNTSITCKILERLITDHIHTIWSENKWLTEKQHGFRKGYSCESSLIGFTQELAENLDQGGQIDGIIIDFSKAFDVVPHNLLINKFSKMGLDNRVVQWIEKFLTDRTQSVQCNTSRSSKVPVSSGVPQGTVLGPALFIGYINDLVSIVDCSVRLFADDCILYTPITAKEDETKLQDALNTVQRWVDENGMKLNASKTTAISFTSKRIPIDTQYSLKGEVIIKAKKCKYLGVTLQDNLKWNCHISKMVSNAKRKLHFVMRNLKGSLRNTKEHAYKCLIRPLVEYCCSVWDPYTQQLIEEIDSVQNKAMRYVLNHHRKWNKAKKQPSLSVREALKNNNWEPLIRRRKRASLKCLWMAANRQPAWAAITTLLKSPTFLGRKDHGRKMQLPRYSTNIGRHSFLGRSIREWNVQPQK